MRWHSIQRPEGLLLGGVHILPPEQLEHSELLLPFIRPALPFLKAPKGNMLPLQRLLKGSKLFLLATCGICKGLSQQRKVQHRSGLLQHDKLVLHTKRRQVRAGATVCNGGASMHIHRSCKADVPNVMQQHALQ